MSPPDGAPTPRAEEALLAILRAQCSEAETALARHVRDTLTELLLWFQGRAAIEADVDDLLATLRQGLVAWQLAHSECWGWADDARRRSVEVLARAVVGQARELARRALLAVPRN